jgi:hypothetical protein
LLINDALKFELFYRDRALRDSGRCAHRHGSSYPDLSITPRIHQTILPVVRCAEPSKS